MSPPPIATVTDRLEPVQVVCLATLVAMHGLVRLTERYLPAYVSALGYGPIVVGALATLGLGVAVVVVEYSSVGGGAGSGSIDGGSTNGDTGEDADDDAPTRERTLAVLSALLAAAGLLAWTGATTLDTLLGTPLSALGWLAVGVVLLQTWHVRGPTRRWWPTDTRVPPFSRVAGSAEQTADPEPALEGLDRRTHVVCGALGIAVASILAVAAVASADTVRAGVPLLAATGAAVALVGAVALGTTVGGATGLEGRGQRTGDGTVARGERSLETVRDAVVRLPDRSRWAVVGDALVRAAIVGIAPFLILLVVEYDPVGLSIGGLTLAPAVVFGLFVLAEASGAIVGAVTAPALADHLDRRGLLAVGLAAVSLFPMALVAAPTSAVVVAALFALFGCRTAIDPLRPTLGSSLRAVPVPGSRLPAGVRTAVRIAVVPAPLVGGLLYALEPLAAFTAATTVGLLGVRELGRAFAFGRAGGSDDDDHNGGVSDGDADADADHANHDR